MTPTPTAIVVGATFGAVYTRALTRADSPVRLAGIVATGSARAHDLAAHHAVPLHTDLAAVPPVDLALVVVRSGIVGGAGSDIATDLLARGIHVLQEQPVHADEMLELSAIAARHGVRYGVNDFYSRLAPVRRFLTAAQALTAQTPARYLQARTSLQVAYPLFTLLPHLVPRLTPARVDALPVPAAPFVTVRLTLDDLAVDLTIDNTLCAADPDNFARLLHEIVLGTDAGELVLTHTHGPTLWRPRQFGAVSDRPLVRRVGATRAPTVAQIYDTLWPDAVLRAVRIFLDEVDAGRNPLSHRFVRAARLWSTVTGAIGPATLFAPPDPPAVRVEDLLRP